ncbi:MAG: hypothetical protein HY519_02600, partial [Candidatus Aenigmarchaeota archaeon]|nr:hypothetical protein [Candidatus Aenigmarchaeota archaeon]
MNLEEREQACLEALGKLPSGKYVLIGGYAASSFDFPRFSVDLDIVIKKSDETAFARLLSADGFRPVEGNFPEVQDVYH